MAKANTQVTEEEIVTPVEETPEVIEETPEVIEETPEVIEETPLEVIEEVQTDSSAIKFRDYFETAFIKLSEAGQGEWLTKAQVKAMVEWAINTL